MTTNEQDLRLKLLNTLLITPHRDLGSIYPVHQEILKQDPRFYVQMAAWYADEGEIRDHKEIFVVNLSLSDFPGHRDVGLALLRAMPPYQIGRVFDFIKGATIRRRVKQEGETSVVSEERGAISICLEGRITRDLDPATLRKVLRSVFRPPGRTPGRRRFAWLAGQPASPGDA